MWDPPGSGTEPVSPALADRFFTTEPPGKLYVTYFKYIPLFNSYKSLQCIFSCPQDELCNLWGPVKNENVGPFVQKV